MTKNIAKLVWDTVSKEMGIEAKKFGTDTTYNGENALLYLFENDDVEVEIILQIERKYD